MKAQLIGLLLVMLSAPAIAADQAGAMDFKFEEIDMRWMGMGLRQVIYADGTIVPGSASQLAEFLAIHHTIPGAMIEFNSPGGDLREALQIGRLIRQSDLQTNIGRMNNSRAAGDLHGICYSACAVAFLGGTIRYAPEGTAFGVHRFAVPQNTMTGAQAMDASQVQGAEVAEYVSFMGIRPGFIGEMNAASPAEINVLSQAKLAALRVITPQRETTWELRTTSTGLVYVAGETKDIRGLHKILFGCPPRGQGPPFMEMMFNASEGQDIVQTTASTRLRINEGDVALLKGEITKGPFVDKAYVSTFIALTPRIVAILRSATTVGVAMVHVSGVTYAGFDADFSDGKEKVMAYLQPCLSQ